MPKRNSTVTKSFFQFRKETNTFFLQYKTNKNCERVVTVVKEAPKYNFEFMPNSRKKQKKTKTYNEESVDLTEDLKMNTSTDSDESFEVLEEI